MFPDDVDDFLENEEQEITNASASFNGRTFLYDFEKGDFVYKNGALVEVVGVAALRIWIEKVIRTEKFKFNIYMNEDGSTETNRYGVALEDLTGSSFPAGFIESEMRRELTEAIMVNTYIEELTDWSFVREGSKLVITFTVEVTEEFMNEFNLVDSTFGMEVPT